MADTLLLDQSAWDLVLDAAGNIAVASEPYSLAQDAASAIRTFQGEVYWDTLVGVPYLTEILAMNPPVALLKQRLVEAALSVNDGSATPDVASAKVYLDGVTGRALSGQVQVTQAVTNQTAAASFTVANPQV